MKTEPMFVDAVTIPGGRRATTPNAVKRLAESMDKIGLLTPITVHSPNESALYIVAGRHRLEAARLLGWEFIDAFVVSGSDIDLELREIAENLHRAELTALERDEQIGRWIELVAAKQVSDRLSETKSKGGRPGKAASAAPEIGVNERDAQRAVKVASLSDEAKQAAREVGLDNNRTALLQVAKEPTATKQVKAMRSLAQQKMDSSIKSNVKERATREVAAIIFENVPASLLPAIKANLGVSGPPSAIIKAIEAREVKAKR
jgi:ParB-like chromosome segregation protein Spo0J